MNPWLDALRALPWILGLALLLATASDATRVCSGAWRRPGRGPRSLMAEGSHASAVDLGLALFTLGLLISADRWWERAIWAAFLAFYAGSLIWRRRHTQSPSPPWGEGAGEGPAALTCPRRGGPACPPTAPCPPMPAETPTREEVPAAICPSPPRGGEGTGEGGRPLAIARWAEPAIVALAAPALWFPTQYPALTTAALALLGAMWLATSLVRRRFWPSAPWNLALALFVFMAAVGVACSAVWDLTLPKVAGLLLGLAAYRALVEFAHDRRSLLLALVGLLAVALAFSALGLLYGELRADKIPLVAAMRVRIPQLDRALPDTQGGRVSTNQLGGTLLFVLPLIVSPSLARRRRREPAPAEWRLWVGMAAIGGAALLSALVLTQSRGAWVGMAAGGACLLGLRWRWGRWPLLVGLIALGLGAWRFWPQIAAQLARNPAATGLASPGTLLWRVEVWERSIGYLQDVPFTGYGLGTFRAVDTLFYGPGIIASGGGESVFDVGVPHAHNVFLQMGFDTGIPGLIAYLAILLLAARECWLLARRASGLYRTLGMGALAALVACHVYGLVDVVALGAKPGVLWWGLLGFIVALGRVAASPTCGDTGGTEGSSACADCL